MSENYKIGEIAKILNIKSYVLRFWESEFPQIAPERTAKGQRLYSEKDLETIKTIQDLLHNKGMTISGAKKVLEFGEDVSLVEEIAELPKLEEKKLVQVSLIPVVKEKKEKALLLEIVQELKEISSILGQKI